MRLSLSLLVMIMAVIFADDSLTAKYFKSLPPAYMAAMEGLPEPAQAYIGAELELCAQDYWEFAKHCETFDEESGGAAPYPTDLEKWGFLDKVVRGAENERTTIVVKNRRLMITWTASVIYPLWKMFQAKYYERVWFGKCTSKNKDDAKEVVQRLGFVYGRLPWYLRGAEKMAKRNVQTFEFNSVVCYEVFAAVSGAGRGRGTNYYCMDEAAYNDNAADCWGSMFRALGSSGHAMIVSTRLGGTWFEDKWNRAQRGENKWHPVELHYYDYPGRDAAWWEETRIEMDDDARFLVEEGDSWDIFKGTPVYPTFSKAMHVTNVKFTPGPDEVIHIGVDWGFNNPAVVWFWKNVADQWCMLREYRPTEIDTEDLMYKVVELSMANFAGCSFLMYPDPAGLNPNQQGRKSELPGEIKEKTNVEIAEGIFREKEFNCRIICSRWTNTVQGIKLGLDAVRGILKIRPNQQPGFLMQDGRCDGAKRMFEGGYHYHEEDKLKDMPVKDGVFDHVADAIRYVVSHVTRIVPVDDKKPAAMTTVVGEIPATNQAYLDDQQGWKAAA